MLTFFLSQMLERFWLRSSDFLTGDEISIADLLMVPELDMLEMLDGAKEVRHLSFPSLR